MNDLNDAARIVTDLLLLLTAKGDLDLTARVTVSTPGASTATTAPELTVELSGTDTALVTERNGELLYAIEHLAAKVLRLEPEEHDRISFDAGHFKANRDRALRQSAEAAVTEMREQRRNGPARPFIFPPMTSRERRLLHLILAPSGLQTASTGEGPRRSVVLYPEGIAPPPQPAANVRPGRRHPLHAAMPAGIGLRPRGFSRR